MKILFITRKSSQCGVADYGRRLYSILKEGMDITMYETGGPDDMCNLQIQAYDTILWNYHHATLPFINCDNKEVKHVALFHEAFQNIQPDQWINVSELPRPLPPFVPPQTDYVERIIRANNPPVIGSFGFGFPDKNYIGIARMVKREFEQAKLRLHVPFAEYGDQTGDMALARVLECKAELEGSNIELEVECRYMEPNNLVGWLSENDINVFNCIPTAGRGISSSIDYALAARRPIAVSNSEMYRHLPREICLDNISLPRLIAKGIEPLRHIYDGNTHAKLIEAVKTKLGI